MPRLVMRVATLCLVLCAELVAPHRQAYADRQYTVRAGDTLAAIARRYRLSVAALKRANRLSSSAIHPGMKLRVPTRGRRGRTRRPRARPSHQGRRGRYRVRRGDTLSGIARRYDVSVAALRRANRLASPMIRPGDRLRIPGRGPGRQRPEGARPSQPSEAQHEALARASKLGLGTSRAAHRLLTRPPKQAWVAAAGSPAPDGALRVPIDSARVLRGWGSGPGGYHLAIDFGARAGTPVRAAAPGIVAYAGNQVRGYGNVVIVVHPRGYVTWYAHHRQNLVVPGQRVERGERLGTVGATGYARGAHLHFMLVHRGQHCDAMPLFRGELRKRSGATLRVSSLRWKRRRPEGLRCLRRSKRPHPGRRSRRH